MEPQQSPSTNTKVIHIVVIILALGLGYIILNNFKSSRSQGEIVSNNLTEASMRVRVENTVALDGVLVAPQGFPQDIPFESDKITDSATTNYPYEHLKQLSLGYRSSKNINQKYVEYMDYMRKTGYQITEEEMNSSKRVISGEKGSAILFVAIDDNSEMGTIVEISYTEPVF